VSSDEFARGLIERFGVFVLPGSSFETEGRFRINIGQEPGSFREALARMSAYCIYLNSL
jgi:aspartate/methionine/tyrosine aminotransferase